MKKSNSSSAQRTLAILLFALPPLAGCAGPSAANTQLRKDNQNLTDQLQTVTQQRDNYLDRIHALESHATTVPQLPQSQLDHLFTVHSIHILSVSHGQDINPAQPGDEGLKIYAQPLDQDGDVLKANGSFKFEVFDLKLTGNQQIGQWNFDAAQTHKNWINILRSAYVFTLPWQRTPEHENLTVKITFTDLLTGISFTDQSVVHVILPPLPADTQPSTQPTSTPSTQPSTTP